MTTLEEILGKEVSLHQLLSEPLRDAFAKTDYQVQFITLDDRKPIEEIDLLLVETFGESEAGDYKPSVLLMTEANTLCIALVGKGEVIGGITFSFAPHRSAVILQSLVIDSQYHNKKLGSILLLTMHDIACGLNSNSMTLFSSNVGRSFYFSFDFTEVVTYTFESTLPFDKELIIRKLAGFIKSYNIDNPSDSKVKTNVPDEQLYRNKELTNFSFFQPAEDVPKEIKNPVKEAVTPLKIKNRNEITTTLCNS